MRAGWLVYNNNGTLWGYQLKNGDLLTEKEARARIDDIQNLELIDDLIYSTEQLRSTTYKEAFERKHRIQLFD